MPRRVWLSLVLLATGVALMVAAQLAGAAPERRGGIFKVGTTGASVQIDPQLSYITTGWWLEYATAAKLYNYRPGGKLVPEVASGFRVSNGGRRYTFFSARASGSATGRRSRPRASSTRSTARETLTLASPAAQFVPRTSTEASAANGMKAS